MGNAVYVGFRPDHGSSEKLRCALTHAMKGRISAVGFLSDER